MTRSNPPSPRGAPEPVGPLEYLTRLVALGLGRLDLDDVTIDLEEVLADLHYGRDGRAA